MSMIVELEIEDTVKRVVRGTRTSGRVHVPKAWIDREVQVCLLPENPPPK